MRIERVRRAEWPKPTHKTGEPIVTTEESISDVLSQPLDPNWSIEELAEQVLATIAAQNACVDQEFVLDAATTTDRQSQRLLRPILACLATKSAEEAGVSPNLYSGQLTFKRTGPQGARLDFGSVRKPAWSCPGCASTRGFDCGRCPSASGLCSMSCVAVVSAATGRGAAGAAANLPRGGIEALFSREEVRWTNASDMQAGVAAIEGIVQATGLIGANGAWHATSISRAQPKQ